MHQVALVTGGARGIGRGIAEALARTGFDVVVDDVREPDEVQDTLQLLQSLGAQTHYVKADISNRDDRQRLVNECRSRFGRLDLLVNNAGVAPAQRVDILEASEESFDRVLAINLKGPYFLTQAVANWMIEQKRLDPERTPKIINISSISAYTSSPSRGEYCISKAGVSMMTRLFADRLAPFGINVYEIRPGIIATDMTKAVKEKYDTLIAQGLTPIARWGLPEDIGKAVAAIASGAFPFSTGEVFNVDGGFHLRRL